MSNNLQYKSYTASLQYSSEDSCFYGKVTGINDLVTFEGSSVSTLKKNFKSAVDDYITTCESLGKSPQKSYKGTFNVRVGQEIHQSVALAASQQSLSLNDYVKRALDWVLKNDIPLNNS